MPVCLEKGREWAAFRQTPRPARDVADLSQGIDPKRRKNRRRQVARRDGIGGGVGTNFIA